ncbi:GbsR/MarR family transcriptional regulator [Lentzea tibetensis]|uniref:GbsR/MarR family transcriptional regulator n=1 Tax=Lentzea tibetensis TaxID=2591470 RepID=UPI001F1A241F|nr:helix-turn-helix domain-containing protein [Lentzea tibetensis]
MTDDKSRRDAAEHLALALTQSGMQRMAARVLAAFLFTDEPSLTAGDVAKQLDASAGSLSGAIKLLDALGMVERVPVPSSRSEHFRMRAEPWADLYSKQNTVIDLILQSTDRGIAAVDDGPARQRLEHMRDFYTFMLSEIPALLERFEARRAK